MEIRFIISRKVNDHLEPFDEIPFSGAKEKIQFGRSSKNNTDVILKDDNNLVSNPHAILEIRSGKFYLTDLDSRNGTFVDGKQLGPNHPVEVVGTSRIELANFIVNFDIIPDIDEVPTITPEPPALSRETPGTIAEKLRAVYKQHADDEPGIRKRALRDVLAQELNTKEPSDIPEFLKNLKELFPDRGYQWHQMKQENEELKNTVEQWTGTGGLLNSSYKALDELMKELVAPDLSFQHGADITRFCDNIKKIIMALLNSFADLDKGRKRVLEELIQIWDQSEHSSPLLEQELSAMTRMLLDWRKELTASDDKASILEKSLQKFVVHELAFLKGYQESTHRGSLNLLDEIAPEKLFSQIGNRALTLGPIKIPYKIFPPLVKLIAWNEYQKRHRQLKVEDKTFFERLFRPSFAAKYKEKVDQSKQASESLDATLIFFRDNIKDITTSF